ncbi:MAG: FAD-binding oxidoreductase [Pseudomonadota bacterium]
MVDTMFGDAYKDTPYWWQRRGSGLDALTPPKSADVLVIGSGYTGLHAAIQTARAGMHTVVIDAGRIGQGCSTRNGGQVSTSIKPSFESLKQRFGAKIAERIFREGQASLDFTANFIAEEKIECDFRVVGRFHGAHSPRQYEQLARASEAVHPVIKTGAFVVPKSDQHTELRTDFYHGGIVFPKHASVDPGAYHAGLARRAIDSGATLIPDCAATDLEQVGNGHEVNTLQGRIHAQHVIVATNGYSGRLLPWLQQRIIPIGSYIIATEELPEDQVNHLFPTNRILSDTRKLVYYYRLSPDRKRILFGGRVSLRETDPRKSGPILRRDLVAIFPDLKEVRIDHSWAGTVGYTFDYLMHAGRHRGVHWAAGYCGSGVGMAGYLGNMIGRQVAGDKTAKTVFADIPFHGRPYYRGNPWFLAPSVLWYRILDGMR